MKRIAMLATALALAGTILTIVPHTRAAKKNVEYIDGVMLGEKYAVKFRSLAGGADAMTSNYDEFHFFVQVGDLVYVGAYHKDWLAHYKPKAEDWPEGLPVQIRFEKKSAFGLIHTTFMYIRRPKGDKEVMTHLFSVMGPDGKQKCGHFYCN